MTRSKFNLQALASNNPELFSQTPDVLALIKSGAARYRKNSFYFRKKVSLSGNQRLVEASTVKSFGVTNLTDGKITPGRAFMIEGLAIRYAYNASTSTVYAQTYSNNIYNPVDVAADSTDLNANEAGVQSGAVAVQLIPTQLTDSEFELSIGGKGLFACMTGDFLVDNLVGDKLRSSAELTVNLEDYPIIIDDKKTIEPWLYFNENVTSPSNNHFIEFVMYGTEIFS